MGNILKPKHVCLLFVLGRAGGPLKLSLHIHKFIFVPKFQLFRGTLKKDINFLFQLVNIDS